jgi:cell division transport system ATP-binding protein
MIRFSQVTKRYPNGHEALKQVSLFIDRQEMVFLIGHSGAGKSTLLKLITRVERSTRGQLIVNERNLTRLPRRQVPYLRREIGVVFQDHKLLNDRTVFDNVALPLVVAGVGHRDTSRRVRAALDKVGLLGKERLFPITLSGGEQQRVGIARAVVNRPPILLADEPTGNLDAELSDEIMDLFGQFNQYGVTVLVATHDRRHIARLGKRVMELSDGSLIQGAEEG